MGVVLKRYLRNLERIYNLRINVRYLSFYNRRHSPLYSLVQNACIRLEWNQHGMFCSQFSYFLSPNMEKIFFHIYGRPRRKEGVRGNRCVENICSVHSRHANQPSRWAHTSDRPICFQAFRGDSVDQLSEQTFACTLNDEIECILLWNVAWQNPRL